MKKIVYFLKGIVYFDVDDDVPINEYLEKIREMGACEIEDVKLMDDKAAEKIAQGLVDELHHYNT